MRTTKVNNKKVKAIPVEHKETRPVKGSDLCPDVYANILLLARKKSGKTSIIYKMIQECAGRDTSIIAFVSTLHKDAQWTSIREYCERKNLPFIGETSMFEGKVNRLEAWVKTLENDEKEEEGEGDEGEEEAPAASVLQFDSQLADEPETKKPERKQRATKYVAPEYIVILDDLSDELKSPVVAALLKKHRHFKMKVIISTQHLNDLRPESLKQVDLVCVLGAHSDDKLEELHGKMALSTPFPLFKNMYDAAVARHRYGFLWAYVTGNEYRKDFDERFEIEP